MCNDHEHHVSCSTDEYNYLCFRHATLEAIQGHHVAPEVQTYQQKTEREVCDRDNRANSLKGMVLVKSPAKGVSVRSYERVDMETVIREMKKNDSVATSKDIRGVLENGNPVATFSHVYQYVNEKSL